MKKSNLDLTIATILIFLAVGLRLLPHAANFAPVAAIAIFGGAILPRRLAVWVPLFAMMISDLFIGFYSTMPITWGCYVLIALASSHWLRKPNFLRGASLTLSSSLFFFFVTNFAVWIWGNMYVHSWNGLSQCYTLALPFFRNTALSDIIYTASLFSLFMLATRLGGKIFEVTEPSGQKVARPI